MVSCTDIFCEGRKDGFEQAGDFLNGLAHYWGGREIDGHFQASSGERGWKRVAGVIASIVLFPITILATLLGSLCYAISRTRGEKVRQFMHESSRGVYKSSQKVVQRIFQGSSYERLLPNPGMMDYLCTKNAEDLQKHREELDARDMSLPFQVALGDRVTFASVAYFSPERAAILSEVSDIFHVSKVRMILSVNGTVPFSGHEGSRVKEGKIILIPEKSSIDPQRFGERLCEAAIEILFRNGVGVLGNGSVVLNWGEGENRSVLVAALCEGYYYHAVTYDSARAYVAPQIARKRPYQPLEENEAFMRQEWSRLVAAIRMRAPYTYGG